MTIAVIFLAAALVAAIGGNVAQALWVRSLVSTRDRARDELVLEQRRGDKLQGERNELAVRAEELTTDKNELERRLAAADSARNKALDEEADDAAAKVRNARDAAAAVVEFNRVLQGEDESAGGTTDRSAASGEHDGGATALQPPGDAGEGTDPVRDP